MIKVSDIFIIDSLRRQRRIMKNDELFVGLRNKLGEHQDEYFMWLADTLTLCTMNETK